MFYQDVLVIYSYVWYTEKKPQIYFYRFNILFSLAKFLYINIYIVYNINIYIYNILKVISRRIAGSDDIQNVKSFTKYAQIFQKLH